MTQIGNVAVEQLKSYIDRIELLEEQKADIATDIRDVYAESKGNGYDTKAMREIIKKRKLDAAERDEQEHLVELYAAALGMRPAPENAA